MSKESKSFFKAPKTAFFKATKTAFLKATILPRSMILLSTHTIFEGFFLCSDVDKQDYKLNLKNKSNKHVLNKAKEVKNIKIQMLLEIIAAT